MEKRNIFFKAEVRSESKEGGELIIRGYPIVFNSETEIYCPWIGAYKEEILPTALEGVDLSNVYLLFGHDDNAILGRAGRNLRLEVDDTGLFMECVLPNTTLARDTYELAAAGLLGGMSFSFASGDWINDSTKKRTITQFDAIWEISLVAFPAYKDATVIVKENKVEESAVDDAQRAAELERQKAIEKLEGMLSE